MKPLPQSTLKELHSLGVKLSANSVVHPASRIVFEAPVSIASTDLRISANPWGAFSYIRDGRLASLASIGRYCSIGPGLTCGDSNHATSHLSTHPFQYKTIGFANGHAEYEAFESTSTMGADLNLPPPRIGHDVWIGANVSIMRGVTIGDGAVVAAGAIVTKDVAPYAIVGGVPAKLIRYRFEEQVVKRLLAVRWWQYKLSSLSNVPFTNIEAALDEIENRAQSQQLAPFRPQRILLEAGRITILPPAPITEGALPLTLLEIATMSKFKLLSAQDLQSAAKELCKIRGIEPNDTNIAEASAQIQAFVEIQAAINSIESINVA